MNNVGNFNIYDISSPTSKDVVVVFSPSMNVKYYSYEIVKDNNVIYTQTSNKIESIKMDSTGKYKINIKATLFDDSVKSLSSGYYNIDKQAPSINVKDEYIEIKKNNIDKVNSNITVNDNFDGDITNKVTTNISELNQNYKGIQKLTYTVEDMAGNVSSKQIYIKYIENKNYTYMYSSIIVIICLILLYLTYEINKIMKLEKRIDAYVLKPIVNEELSIFEKLISRYQLLTNKISAIMKKSVFVSKYSHRLEKYLPITNIHDDENNIFAGKILIGFLFVIIALIIDLFKYQMLKSYEMVIVFTFGFFTLDILYFLKYKVFRWKLESDFTSAIIIMNNAFKSGNSIIQAIDIVSNELKGTMGKEFKRMSLELLYGLELEVVFKRFAKRINLEEANYLTASLTILNKTGGDIIKVFDSIEKNMFDKRKLRLELASLTSGSKIVVTVLLGMPFFFCLLISMIDPSYFLPFFTTYIGVILLIFMLIYYIIFVVVVRKIMKVVMWWIVSFVRYIVIKP